MKQMSTNAMHSCSVCPHLYFNLSLSPMPCPLTRTFFKSGDHSISISNFPSSGTPSQHIQSPACQLSFSPTLVHYWSTSLICSLSILPLYTLQSHFHSFLSHVQTIWGVLFHPFNHSTIHSFHYIDKMISSDPPQVGVCSRSELITTVIC